MNEELYKDIRIFVKTLQTRPYKKETKKLRIKKKGTNQRTKDPGYSSVLISNW